jgi:HEAT repeat protein
VRVPEEAVAGKAKITASFPDWKEGKVAPATFEMTIEDAKDAIAAHIKILSNSKRETEREAAARALGAIGPQTKEVVPALVRALADSEWFVRQSAAVALGRIGPAAKEALPALTKALRDEREQVRTAASDAIQDIKAEK